MNNEYLMLREEILHLDGIINNTLNILYVFIATFLAYALGQEDTFYILLSYIGVIPMYIIVVSKIEGMCRIGAYLKVYHEGKEFMWETRNMELKKKRGRNNFTFVISSFFPFEFINIAIFIIFILQTKWNLINSLYEKSKITIAILLFLILTISFWKNRDMSTRKFLKEWENLN